MTNDDDKQAVEKFIYVNESEVCSKTSSYAIVIRQNLSPSQMNEWKWKHRRSGQSSPPLCSRSCGHNDKTLSLFCKIMARHIFVWLKKLRIRWNLYRRRLTRTEAFLWAYVNFTSEASNMIFSNFCSASLSKDKLRFLEYALISRQSKGKRRQRWTHEQLHNSFLSNRLCVHAFMFYGCCHKITKCLLRVLLLHAILAKVHWICESAIQEEPLTLLHTAARQ